VAVVDDDPLVRAALAMMLRGAPDVQIVGEAGDGVSGLALVERERPDVVLMDIRMPVMDGLEALAALMRWEDPPKVIVLTTFDDDEVLFFDDYDDLASQVEKLLKQKDAAALAKVHPGVNMNVNHVYTFEALLIAADAYKRAGSADPNALADAVRTTNIKDNVSIGPGIQFDAKGQNDKILGGGIQNRAGKLITVAPKEAANGKPEWPLKPYDKRG